MSFERNDFSNSEVLYLPSTSHQVSAKSNKLFWIRCYFKIFKIVAITAILDIGTNDFSSSEFPCHSDGSQQVSVQTHLRFGRCGLKTFKMTTMTIILDI